MPHSDSGSPTQAAATEAATRPQWETPGLTILSLVEDTLLTLSNVSSDGVLFS